MKLISNQVWVQLSESIMFWLNSGKESHRGFFSYIWVLSAFVENHLNLPTLTYSNHTAESIEIYLIFLQFGSPFCASPFYVRAKRNDLWEEEYVLGDALYVLNHPCNFPCAKGLKWQPLENNYMKHHVWAKCEMSPVPTEAIDIFIKY